MEEHLNIYYYSTGCIIKKTHYFNFQEADNNAVRQNRLVDHLKGETATLKSEVENRGVTIGNLNHKVCVG
jgi:hypothetical protein